MAGTCRAAAGPRFSATGERLCTITAMCFDAGGSPHCAPNREVCEALRDASHQTVPCRPRAPPAAPGKK